MPAWWLGVPAVATQVAWSNSLTEISGPEIFFQNALALSRLSHFLHGRADEPNNLCAGKRCSKAAQVACQIPTIVGSREQCVIT